jgi:hypothetical protein
VKGRGFLRERDGGFQVRLEPDERRVLRELPRQAMDLLDPDLPSSQRLFPTAYPTDEVADADYRALTGGELVRRHRDALTVLADTAEADEIDENQLQAWLAALEALRLIIGTQLDVAEDPEEVPRDDPRAPGLSVYRYLSWLQGEVVDVLAANLPAGGSADRTC